jgi:acetoin utilization deacetylase AcuC-like enzyme
LCALAGRGQGGLQPGGAGADDRQVGLHRGYGTAIAAPLLFSHPSSLEHDTGAHPENAQRIRAIAAELSGRDWLGWERRKAPQAELEQLLRVHPQDHVDRVREVCSRAAAFDLDTPTSHGSWEAALHAAGAGCAMVDALLAGEAPVAFCALRPPGHHAEPARAMGFCLFSNAAIAARHALASGLSRVMVLDWDVHHGNGTNAALHDSAEALFVSLHRYPFYPGTGPLSDAGSGEGTGFSLNLPLPGGSDEDEWLSLMEHVVAPVAAQFRPELVLVCAGYDAHRNDPLGGCLLETSSYGELGRWSRLLGERVGAPVGCLLEGGYDLDALASSVAATMEALTDSADPRSVPAGPLVDHAAEQVGRFWSL